MSSTLQTDPASSAHLQPSYPSLTTTRQSLTLIWSASPERPWLAMLGMLCLAPIVPGLLVYGLLSAGVTPNWDDYGLLFVLIPLIVAANCYCTWAGHYANQLRIDADGTLTLGSCKWRMSNSPVMRAANSSSQTGRASKRRNVYSVELCVREQTLHLPSFSGADWRTGLLAQISQWLTEFCPGKNPQQERPSPRRDTFTAVLLATVGLECLWALFWSGSGTANTTPDLRGPLAPTTLYLLFAAWILLGAAWRLMVAPAKDADLVPEHGTVAWINATFVFLLIAATVALTYCGQRQATFTTPGISTTWLTHPQVSPTRHCHAWLAVKDPQTGQTATSCNLDQGYYKPDGRPIEVLRVTNQYGTTDTLLRMASAPG